MRNVLFVISGPSGVGKGTIVRQLLKEDDSLALSVSCTTRSPRICEEDGKDYFFISEEEFMRRIDADDFLEYDKHFEHYYGTPRSFVEKMLREKSVILEIDVVGALNAKRLMPSAVLVMLAPPSIEELAARLAGRGSEKDGDIAQRLERGMYELSQKEKYDYVVINDDMEAAKRRLQEIIQIERNKTERR